MVLFTRERLKELIERQKGVCVSLYMPTHRTAAETQQDQIRFKNLLGEAEKALSDAYPEEQELLQPARNLLEDNPFWQHQGDGLAVFLSSGEFQYFRLPISLEELVVVGERWHLKPLISLLSGDGRFYVLALSQGEVRLFQCTRHSVGEIALEGIPGSMAEALKYDDPERQVQFRTPAPTGKGKRAAIFHGHGVGTDDSKDNILRYFRQIDKGLRALLGEERAPLVLAGVGYLFPIYREANAYPNLLEKGITGNPEGLKERELHGQAWNIVEPHFQKEEKEAAERYRQLANTDRASSDLKAIVPAAYYGKVVVLFVAAGIQQWGTFEPQENVIDLHSAQKPGDEDLLDLAAVQTLLHGGTVYAVDHERVPDEEAALAAIYRY
jgi:hypothetical protein